MSHFKTRVRKTRRIQLRVDDELHAVVKTIAAEQRLTVSTLIERYLRSLAKARRPDLDDFGIEQA